MRMTFIQRLPPPCHVYGGLEVTSYCGADDVRAALTPVLSRSPHDNILTLRELAVPETEQIVGATLEYRARGKEWQASLVSTPRLTFVSPVHEEILPDLVGLIRRGAPPEAEGALPVCAMDFMIPPLMQAWEQHTGQKSSSILMIDYYLHHHGIMPDIPVHRESGRLELLAGGGKDAPDKAADSRCYLWRDARNVPSARMSIVTVGETGAFIAAYEGSRDPFQTFNHIADMTRALHSEGRWVGVAAFPDEADKRRVSEALGYEKVGRYGVAVLQVSPTATAPAPR